jgi:hypothetical protein
MPLEVIVKKWSNKDLLDQLIIRANQVGILSESNEVRELCEEVLLRMSSGMANNEFKVTTRMAGTPDKDW